MKIFTSDKIKAIERYQIKEEKVTAIELVERVAEAVTCEIISRWRQNKRISIFAGSGNNGADALAVARLLIEQGYNPEIFLFNIGGNSLSAECKISRERLLMLGDVNLIEFCGGEFVLPELSRNHVVIDGLFGSGLHDPLSGGFMLLVRKINESGAAVVSIDLPSGMFCDWNHGSINRNVIHATLTLAVQFPHLPFMISDYAELVGEWKVLDIDMSSEKIRATDTPYNIIEKNDVKRILKKRSPFSSKKDYGTAMLIAGSYGMMGAAVLTAKGALRAGAGKVIVHTARCGYNILQSSVPEALYDADRDDIIVTNMLQQRHYTSLAIGPGIGTNEATVTALENLLKANKSPLVLDADALNCIALRPTLLNHIPAMSILCPHAGEFDRIFGIQPSAEERLKRAIEVAMYYKIIIVLKGHHTAVIRPDGRVMFNSTGNAGMATGGSGDVLTGAIAAMLAQGFKPEISATIAVYIHGLAGDLALEEHGEYGVTASDIANNIGKAIKVIMT